MQVTLRNLNLLKADFVAPATGISLVAVSALVPERIDMIDVVESDLGAISIIRLVDVPGLGLDTRDGDI